MAEPKTTPVQEHYVVFMDILGFSNRIDSLFKRHSIEQIKKDVLMEAINELLILSKRKIVSRTGAELPTVNMFSDSVIVSAPNTHDGLLFIISSAWLYTHKLMARGAFVRGAITRGPLLVLPDKAEVIGPAFNEAVNLEKLANYPRVILAAGPVQDIRAAKDDYAKGYRKMLRVGSDGFVHVRPVQDVFFTQDPNAQPGAKVEDIAAERLAMMEKAIIEKTLNDKERAKLIWLRNEIVDCVASFETDFQWFEKDVYPLVRIVHKSS